MLRALAPTKPNLERENEQQAKERDNPRKQNLRTQKSPHTRNPTKAHTCPRHVLRALAPTKPNSERGKWTASKRTGKSTQTKSQNAKIPTHTHTPIRAHTCPRHVLRALAPRKPNLERENPRKQNLRMQKSPHTRANPTKAHTCPQHVLRALAPTKPNSERENGQQAKELENPRKQNLRTQKSPHTRANPTKAHTCPRHVLRALAPRKPNLERENPRKQNLRMQKSPPTRATPPRRTRAHGTCCVRLLQPSRT